VKLGKDAFGCRQMTLLEAGVPPLADLVQVEAQETREYWRRRLVAKRVRLPDFVVIVDDQPAKVVGL